MKTSSAALENSASQPPQRSNSRTRLEPVRTLETTPPRLTQWIELTIRYVLSRLTDSLFKKIHHLVAIQYLKPLGDQLPVTGELRPGPRREGGGDQVLIVMSERCVT